MTNREIKDLLLDAKEKLKINEEIKLSIKPMKKKVASISLINKNLLINKNFLENATSEEIKYVIFHELLHLKYGIFHTQKFKSELKKYFPEIDLNRIQGR